MLPAIPSVPRLTVLRPGYSYPDPADGATRANGSCTLVRDAGQTILVDTLGPWDAALLTDLLLQQSVRVQDVDVVVCTHMHPDHAGNMNLFTNSRLHVSGFSVYQQDRYLPHPFDQDVPFVLTPNVRVIATPGHTLSCVSVVVQRAEGLGTVVVAGDLFEKEEDVSDESVWKEAGSEDHEKQIRNRARVLQLADHIVPGHGPMFRVTRP